VVDQKHETEIISQVAPAVPLRAGDLGESSEGEELSLSKFIGVKRRIVLGNAGTFRNLTPHTCEYRRVHARGKPIQIRENVGIYLETVILT
jgi:hypothetical protein